MVKFEISGIDDLSKHSFFILLIESIFFDFVSHQALKNLIWLKKNSELIFKILNIIKNKINFKNYKQGDVLFIIAPEKPFATICSLLMRFFAICLKFN